MKPNPIRYVIAHCYRISAFFGAIVLAVIVTYWSWSPTAWFFIALLLAVPFGAILSLLTVYPLAYVVGESIQGAPFQANDRVRILIGAHKNRVTLIKSVWKDRNQVILEMTPEESKDARNVYFTVEVCREPD